MGDLNWSIAIVCLRDLNWVIAVKCYDLNWSIERTFSGAFLLRESWFVFQS